MDSDINDEIILICNNGEEYNISEEFKKLCSIV